MYGATLHHGPSMSRVPHLSERHSTVSHAFDATPWGEEPTGAAVAEAHVRGVTAKARYTLQQLLNPSSATLLLSFPDSIWF